MTPTPISRHSAQLDYVFDAAVPPVASDKRSLTVLELSRLGLRERVVPADGNGLFYAVLDQMKQRGHPKLALYSHDADPSHSARTLRDQTVEFAKRPEMKPLISGYGSATAAAMAIAWHGNHLSEDGNLTATTLAQMLDLNLVILSAGRLHRLNDAAAARGMPQMTIVRDETTPDIHFNSTDPMP